MKEYSLFIPLTPIAKLRPRFTKRGFAYTPKKVVDYEDMIRLYWNNKFKKHILLNEPLSVEINIQLKRSKTKQYPTARPDVDNLAKSVLDALNGYAYRDDSCIIDLHAKKVYDPNVGINIIIKPVEK